MEVQFTHLPDNKRIYLASDFHLGVPNPLESLVREKKIIRWLNSIERDAEAIILAGDIFDFWFEYKHVVPKGFIRFLGKIAALKDRGIPVIFFTGNHDLWMADYFSRELDVTVIRQPTTFLIGRNKIMIGHGDGLGPGDRKFKLIKKVFKNKAAQTAFRWLHPDLSFRLAKFWSKKSREEGEDEFLGEDELILQYCKGVESREHHDFYIFGHRHLPLELKVSKQATYLNLGEWFDHCTYVEIDTQKATLKRFEG